MFSKLIAHASALASDPARAERNLSRFASVADISGIVAHLKDVAGLFAASQFLANFSIQHPEELFWALKHLNVTLSKTQIEEDARSKLPLEIKDLELKDLMKAVRLFRKRWLLLITLRDISGVIDIKAQMQELTALAEVIIEQALTYAHLLTKERFGSPPAKAGGLCLIALGKLGAEELNYSSDVDLIAAYGTDYGQTSGVLSPSGIRIGRISTHEYFVKIIELLNKLLSTLTEDGICYRVDLRLRPQGQKGEIAIPLEGYKAYYESWARTWERMVMIRARPVAGDNETAETFMKIVEPFVWRSMIDYSELEEIRSMKKKIDSTFLKNDIKRGYGGIREAEFFVQTFQLIYGSERHALRTHRFCRALEALRDLGLIPEQDFHHLKENYLYLRRLEHYLQMMDDLQTHEVPQSQAETEALARRLGYQSAAEFQSDLKVRRMLIKNMYNSLLGTKEDIRAEALSLLEEDLSDSEIAGFLSFRGVQNTEPAIMNLKKIKERLMEVMTPGEREHARRILPELLDAVLKSESPDRGLAGLESFLSVHGIKEAFLAALAENRELLSGVIKILSLSPYLTRTFLSDPAYLNRLIEEFPIRKTMRRTEAEIERVLSRGEDFLISLAEYKITEELRLGAFFLMDIIRTPNLLRYLSHLADAVIRAIVNRLDTTGFAVIAMGKLGGREITYGSDLDLIFVSDNTDGTRNAESVIKTLSFYTRKGTLYSIDMRLRPDGSRGVLVNDTEGYRNYYEKAAWQWELQALLKARAVAGDMALGYKFMNIAKDVIMQRGKEVTKDAIASMRKKIIKEASLEHLGIDIKLGPGGIEEIEFYLQWLAMNNAQKYPDLLVQNTSSLLHRLQKHCLIKDKVAQSLASAYEYLRKLETFLRLNEVVAVTADSDVSALAARFMGHADTSALIAHIKSLRDTVREIVSA